jgi:hypothetical protein
VSSPADGGTGQRGDATLPWLSTAVIALGAVESLVNEAPLGAVLVLVVVGIAVVPPILARSPWVTVPWPVLLGGVVAVVMRTVGVHRGVATHLLVGTAALLVVVELDALTPVELSRRFAVALAALTTLAMQGLWTIAQYYSDAWLGSDYITSQTELQWDMVSVTAVGLLLGAFATLYFVRFDGYDSLARQTVDGQESPPATRTDDAP